MLQIQAYNGLKTTINITVIMFLEVSRNEQG